MPLWVPCHVSGVVPANVCRCIVTLMGAVTDGPGRAGPMLVMEFMANGSLHDILQVSSSLRSLSPSLYSPFPLLCPPFLSPDRSDVERNSCV